MVFSPADSFGLVAPSLIFERYFFVLCREKNFDFVLDFVPLHRNFAAVQFFAAIVACLFCIGVIDVYV